MLDVGIPIDAAGHHVADVRVPAILGGKPVVIVKNHTANGSRTVTVLANVRGKSKAVVGLPKTGIIGSVQKHISGRAMAIRRPQIAQWIEHQPKRIDLAERVLLDVRSIRSEPVTIPRVDCDAAAVESCY